MGGNDKPSCVVHDDGSMFCVDSVKEHSQSQRNPFIGRSVCVVCGDRARGCNFGAITCASCKEFFRRNAFKLKKLKCYFDRRCEINVYSRRFCAACRLAKCYRIGMKSEYIMSEEEKNQRQNKIYERKLNGKNRLKPTSSTSQPNQNTNDDELYAQFAVSPGFESQPLAQPNVYIEYQPMAYMENSSFPIPVDSNLFESYNPTPPPPPVDQFGSPLPPTGYREEEPQGGWSRELEESETMKKLLRKVKIIRESNYYPTKFHLLVRTKEKNRRVSNHGSCKLKYLTSIIQIMQAETIHNLPSGHKFIELIRITEIVTFNFIKMYKKLYAFQVLSQEDQVALVKGGVMETLMIWSMMTINLEKECWEALDLERNIKFSLQMEMFKEANPKLYDKHRSYALSFEPEWRYNDNLMSLLIAIALFNPDREGIFEVQKIREERRMYCELLKQYLSTMYEDSSVNEMFSRLMNQLQLTTTISDYHVKAYFDVSTNEVVKNGVGGLIMQIFDLNN